MNVKRINIEDCCCLLEENNVTIIDIRDSMSFRQGHIENATHVQDLDIEDFVETADKNAPLLVYCYHGHSSISASMQLAEYGFTNIYSLDGGYEAWKMKQ